jgi:hypothetical protein
VFPPGFGRNTPARGRHVGRCQIRSLVDPSGHSGYERGVEADRIGVCGFEFEFSVRYGVFARDLDCFLERCADRACKGNSSNFFLFLVFFIPEISVFLAKELF